MKRIFLLLVVFIVASCAPKIKTERLSMSEGDKMAATITNDWVATDSDLAVKYIAEKLSNNNRYKRYMMEHNYMVPKMFVGEIENQTSEDNFPITAFNNKLLNTLFENGDFDLVSVKDRNKILKEIKYQNDGMVKAADVKSIGKASGADLILNGEVAMETKIFRDKTLKEYSVSIRLVDIESGEEVARVLYETTKYSKQKKIGW